MNAESDENDRMKRAKEAIEKYYFQLTEGCGRLNCSNQNCASNQSFVKLAANQAASRAVQLARDKAELCEFSSKAAKQFKPSTSSQALSTSSSALSTNENKIKTSEIQDQEMEKDELSDDESVIYKSDRPINSASSMKSTADLKSLDDALKYVTKINKNSISKDSVYLNETNLLKLIKKCKESKENEMDTDAISRNSSKSNYSEIINLVQRVFQSYKSLSQSFTYDDSQKKIEISTTMPSIPPFNIDFNAVRRSYSLLFGIANEGIVERLEETLDHAVYALCVSIRMILKKNDISETEMNQILHSLLVVNELPILEDPKYMDRCAKIFYATFSELPDKSSVKIIQMWSKWQTDELKIILDKLQQYITVCAISKNLDEESNNRANENEEDDINESEKNCLHKSEGIAGAVGVMRYIYYASLIGGRLDSEEQIKKERAIEDEEIKLLESSINMEGDISQSDSLLSLSTRIDPLEEILNIRPYDCREPKIPHEKFLNEIVNKFIDIQQDYVEYIQQIQNLENQSHQSQNSTTPIVKKRIFSFLANSFCLVLSKKNLGLYYDNKIKMMRERRHNIMMSLLEGSMPMPYFKIRLDRNNLLLDALSLIELQEQENSAILRKQLFIEFENELGIDQGGVSKEFFQLAIDELLNKGYTFFVCDEKTRYYWFTPCTLESEKEFRLIGMLFGIAIYNNIILDVQFPPVFFRKLMGKLGTLEDLQFSHPQLYQSFISLLDFEGTDEEFEDCFMQTFQISVTDNFESVVNFNLKENGDKIPVTKQNRKEFVDLYADFILNKGIDEAFKAFRRGFVKITFNSPLAKWYSPEELEILLCGSNVMDWKSLEDSTVYDSGFEVNHLYIKQFWNVFNEFTVDEKRLFLKFTTGTDRCPHGGLSELKLTIARNGPDTDKLPTAHTCFNVLLLPEYSSEQKLKEKLVKAIQYSRGFGLS